MSNSPDYIAAFQGAIRDEEQLSDVDITPVMVFIRSLLQSEQASPYVMQQLAAHGSDYLKLVGAETNAALVTLFEILRTTPSFTSQDLLDVLERYYSKLTKFNTTEDELLMPEDKISVFRDVAIPVEVFSGAVLGVFDAAYESENTRFLRELKSDYGKASSVDQTEKVRRNYQERLTEIQNQVSNLPPEGLYWSAQRKRNWKEGARKEVNRFAQLWAQYQKEVDDEAEKAERDQQLQEIDDDIAYWETKQAEIRVEQLRLQSELDANDKDFNTILRTFETSFGSARTTKEREKAYGIVETWIKNNSMKYADHYSKLVNKKLFLDKGRSSKKQQNKTNKEIKSDLQVKKIIATVGMVAQVITTGIVVYLKPTQKVMARMLRSITAGIFANLISNVGEFDMSTSTLTFKNPELSNYVPDWGRNTWDDESQKFQGADIGGITDWVTPKFKDLVASKGYEILNNNATGAFPFQFRVAVDTEDLPNDAISMQTSPRFWIRKIPEATTTVVNTEGEWYEILSRAFINPAEDFTQEKIDFLSWVQNERLLIYAFMTTATPILVMFASDALGRRGYPALQKWTGRSLFTYFFLNTVAMIYIVNDSVIETDSGRSLVIPQASVPTMGETGIFWSFISLGLTAITMLPGPVQFLLWFLILGKLIDLASTLLKPFKVIRNLIPSKTKSEKDDSKSPKKGGRGSSQSRAMIARALIRTGGDVLAAARLLS